MFLRDDVDCIKAAAGKPLTPEATASMLRLLEFLDVVLQDREIDGKYDWVGELPRRYYVDVGAKGNLQLCVSLNCESDLVAEQYAYIAADVATGFLCELCNAVHSVRAAEIRAACGLSD